MQIQKNRRQQNLAFGTAYVGFNQKEFYKLPEVTQKRVIKMLTKGVNFVQLSDDFISSAEGAAKVVQTSFHTDNTALRFTHEHPKKEHQLVKIFKDLFGDNAIHTQIIENSAENAKQIEKANEAQQGWVISGK